MKYIIITDSFKKQLKKFRRYFDEKDFVLDVKKYVLEGLRNGETKLADRKIHDLELGAVKLRFCINQVNFRYIIENIEGHIFIPIIIDLKKEHIGGNLGFKNVDAKTKKAVLNAENAAITDFESHTEENPKYTLYQIGEV
jgi:hypothetical protein